MKGISTEVKILLGSSVVAVSLMFLAIVISVNNYQWGILPMDLAVAAAGVFFIPFGIYDRIKMRRIKKIEEKFPDFLRDVAESSRFGMTLAEAIITASGGRYGVLSAEIKKMAAQISWGVPVNQALEMFKERVGTPLVVRMVSIIQKANEAGGNVSDVLHMVSRAAKEVQNMQKEKEIQMSSYTIVLVIAYFVFVITIIILNTNFFPRMMEMGRAFGSALETAGAGAALTFGINVELIPAIQLLLIMGALIHGVGDGIMAGVMKDGRLQTGTLFAGALVVAGYLFLRLTNAV